MSDRLINGTAGNDTAESSINPKHQAKVRANTAALRKALQLALLQSEPQSSNSKEPPSDQGFSTFADDVSTAWVSDENPTIRDLAWLLSKPSLFVPETLDYSAFEWPAFERLASLTQTPATQRLTATRLDLLTATVAATNDIPSRSDTNRLGQYYEALIAFLQHHFYPHYQCFQNVQLIADKQTLGEADFIVEMEPEKWCHLEVAIKFFLLRDDADADPQNLSHWVGPNSRDRLDKKLRHMNQQQLALLQNTANLALLNQTLSERGLEKPIDKIEAKHLLQGALFTHLYTVTDKSSVTNKSETINTNTSLNNSKAAHHLPLPFNTEAHAGYWIRYNELCILLDGIDNLEQGELRWVLLKKTEWLGGLHQLEWQDRAISNAELIATLKGISLPRLVLCLSPSGGENLHWNELKLMITTDYWPDTRIPSRNI